MDSAGYSLDSERYLKQLLEAVPHEELGAKLRAHRLNARMSIRDLAAKAMLSKTSIVSMEKGKGCRPVTLEKVCRALSLHVERLLSPKSSETKFIHKSSDSTWFGLDTLTTGPIGVGPSSDPLWSQWLDAGVKNPMTIFQNVPADAGFIAGIVEIHVPTEPRSHPGAEFGYVLDGTVVANINDKDHTVSKGDAFFIPSNAKHSYRIGSESDLARVFLVRLI